MKNFEVEIPMTIMREADQYVAYTPALDLCTSGATLEEAQANFAEIVNIFFEEIMEQGTLHEVLSDLGWEQKDSNWIPPEIIAQSTQQVFIN